jgi:hypothetical protein
MSSINILESLWTISPIKINRESDGCATLLLDDVLMYLIKTHIIQKLVIMTFMWKGRVARM